MLILVIYHNGLIPYASNDHVEYYFVRYVHNWCYRFEIRVQKLRFFRIHARCDMRCCFVPGQRKYCICVDNYLFVLEPSGSLFCIIPNIFTQNIWLYCVNVANSWIDLSPFLHLFSMLSFSVFGFFLSMHWEKI